MLRIYRSHADRLFQKDVTGEQSAALPASGVVWYDLCEPTMAEKARVDAAMSISIPTREETEEIEVSSRLYNEDGAEFMTVTGLAHLDTDAPIKSPVVFVLKGDVLVTLRYAPSRPFENVVERMAKPGALPCGSGEQVMLALIEAMVDRLADALEAVGDRIDRISHDVFRPGAKDGAKKRDLDLQAAIEHVGRGGELLGLARESLVSFNRLVTYHQGMGENREKNPDSKARLRTIQRDVAALSDHASYLGSKVGFILDATLGLINLEQNQIIKIFSIAAVCLMPPTLVASIYGMNFKNLPELQFEFGYPMALIMMFVTGIAPYLYFKRRGWL